MERVYLETAIFCCQKMAWYSTCVYKLSFMLLPILALALTGCDVNPFEQKAGLKVTANSEATVFLNDTHVGKAPLEKEDLNPGEHTIRVSTDTQAVIRKTRLSKGMWTLMNVEFGAEETQTASELVSLEKGEGFIVTSDPDGATVSIDGNMRGITPLSLRNIDEGTHVLSLAKEGYLERSVTNLKITAGRLVTIAITLPKAQGTSVTNQATPSALPPETPGTKTVTILETGTGWLRVRSSPSLSGTEIAKITVGQSYPYTEENSGWAHITLPDGRDGWILAQFTKKN